MGVWGDGVRFDVQVWRQFRVHILVWKWCLCWWGLCGTWFFTCWIANVCASNIKRLKEANEPIVTVSGFARFRSNLNSLSWGLTPGVVIEKANLPRLLTPAPFRTPSSASVRPWPLLWSRMPPTTRESKPCRPRSRKLSRTLYKSYCVKRCQHKNDDCYVLIL